MDYQRQIKDQVLQILKDRKAQYCGIAYYAWPQTFGSTSGPCGGIGGCAMSTFTVEAWVCDDYGPTVYTCAGMYHFENERFEPFKNINKWMPLPEPPNT